MSSNLTTHMKLFVSQAFWKCFSKSFTLICCYVLYVSAFYTCPCITENSAVALSWHLRHVSSFAIQLKSFKKCFRKHIYTLYTIVCRQVGSERAVKSSVVFFRQVIFNPFPNDKFWTVSN